MDNQTQLKSFQATKPKPKTYNNTFSTTSSNNLNQNVGFKFNCGNLVKPKASADGNDGLLRNFALKDLPIECLSTILSFLPYDDLSRSRGVCRTFDHVCKLLLNAGFVKAERYHGKILHRVKSQLPRRESERRTHELARHADILTAIETRLSLLSMTFKKYMDNGYCCFIPGKVLDEIFRVLRLISAMPKGDDAPRSHEVLRELRDISSMAMEYFDEQLAPNYRDTKSVSSFMSNGAPMIVVGSPSPDSSTSSTSASSWLLFNATPSKTDGCGVIKFGNFLSSEDGNNVVARAPKFNADVKRVKNLERQMHSQRILMSVYRKELCYNQSSVKRLQEKIFIQNRQMIIQNRRLEAMNRKLLEHEGRFVEMAAEMRNNNAFTGEPSAAPSLPNNMEKFVSIKRPLDDDDDDAHVPEAKFIKTKSSGEKNRNRYSLRSTRIK